MSRTDETGERAEIRMARLEGAGGADAEGVAVESEGLVVEPDGAGVRDQGAIAPTETACRGMIEVPPTCAIDGARIDTTTDE